jgi:hypothetical protein
LCSGETQSSTTKGSGYLPYVEVLNKAIKAAWNHLAIF